MQITVAMLPLFCLIIMIQILSVRDKLIPMIDSNFCLMLVNRGDRIAQLICEKIEMVDLVEEQVCS